MSDREPFLLVTKFGQLSAEDRTTLRAAGIIALEVDQPEDVRFIRPGAEIESTEMLRVAMKAIKDNGDAGGTAYAKLGVALVNAILAKDYTP